MRIHRTLLTIGLLLTVTAGMAQRHQENSCVVGIGSTNILDTYISPEEYTGTELRVMGQSIHWLKKHRYWKRICTHMGTMANASPRADNVDYLSGLYTFNLAYRHIWPLNNGPTLEAGAQVEGGAGFLYNTRNSNNPAQARLYMNLGPSVAAAYRFTLFRKTMRLQYEATAPLAGLLFSPNYGQSYYEIFSRGNYDHNIVPTTPLCAPTLRHSLVLDIPLKRSSIRVGYMGDFQQAEVNSLKYHTYSHLLLIGYAKNI